MMIKNIKRVLKKRKAKVFFIFLACSATIWFLKALSQTYVSTAAFDLKYENLPDGYLFKGASKEEMDVKLRAGGFQFLGFNFKNNVVSIDVSEAQKNAGKFFIPENNYRVQIEKQLSESMALLEIDNDTLFLNMLPVITKKVPVKPRMQIDLGQNYLLDGKVKISPDSISITGPEGEIDSIFQLRTEKIILPDLTDDFTEELNIAVSPQLKNTSISETEVVLSGRIVRFSERVFQVPVTVINVPKQIEIKTFPDMVSVVCKAKIKRLKLLKETDFQVTADYATQRDRPSEELFLKLSKRPEGLHSVRLKVKNAEFIIKKR